MAEKASRMAELVEAAARATPRRIAAQLALFEAEAEEGGARMALARYEAGYALWLEASRCRSVARDPHTRRLRRMIAEMKVEKIIKKLEEMGFTDEDADEFNALSAQ